MGFSTVGEQIPGGGIGQRLMYTPLPYLPQGVTALRYTPMGYVDVRVGVDRYEVKLDGDLTAGKAGDVTLTGMRTEARGPHRAPVRAAPEGSFRRLPRHARRSKQAIRLTS
ncbi:hypothetical protein GCM10017771_88800 [Streptomyces capitiformicae]|uniref:Uncharacterized protein n=1 Tax=Streptomyces capitiformicae TaxID=2014920 RepID=A0A918ZQP8_9ACTN|nr:hypothetical protein GCM10017771_88800 [Streptomyces capitiformicae]